MDKRNEKRVVQDIVASPRRSIRSVPPRSRRIVREEEIVERVKEVEVESEEEVEVDEVEVEEQVPIRRVRSIPQTPTYSTSPSPKRPRRKIYNIFITFLVVFSGIAIIAVALSLLYSKAAVTITPKTASFEVSQTITTRKSTDANFGYQVVSASREVKESLPAPDGPLVETKAKGTATLYNEQTSSQVIVAGTRLSNSEGLVYRTIATVTIPPVKSDKTPGSISIGVLADQAGTKYNMSTSANANLKVVAFQGGPKATLVYAKMNGAVSGGFSGNRKVISPDVETAAVAGAKDAISKQLMEELKTLVPADSVLYKDAYTIEYDVSEPRSLDAQTAEITVKGTLYGAALKKIDLIRNIAGKEVDKFTPPTYGVEGVEDLSFTLINAKDFSPRAGTPFIFSVKGPVKLVGTFSEEQLKNDLKGTYLRESNAVFATYPAISNAYARITPFWMRYFPNSTDKIVVEIK